MTVSSTDATGLYLAFITGLVTRERGGFRYSTNMQPWLIFMSSSRPAVQHFQDIQSVCLAIPPITLLQCSLCDQVCLICAKIAILSSSLHLVQYWMELTHVRASRDEWGACTDLRQHLPSCHSYILHCRIWTTESGGHDKEFVRELNSCS